MVDYVSECWYSDAGPLRHWLATQLPRLAPELRAEYFGDGEKRPRSASSRVGSRDYRRYVESDRPGYGFWGNGYWLWASLSERAPSVTQMFFDHRLCSRIKEFFIALEPAGLSWGLACHRLEFEHRNLLRVRFRESQKGEMTVWVGRDCRKYIPGAYWQNYVARAYLEQHGLSEWPICGDVRWLATGALVQLYDNADEWEQHRERIDSEIYRCRAYFSMRDLRVPPDVSFADHQAILKYASEWP